MKAKDQPEVPDHKSPKSLSIPRWVVPVYWTAGFVVVHNVLPWGLSLLSTRYGWVEGRPGLPNLFSLALIAVGVALVVWTMVLHLAQTPQRVEMERTPSYLLIRGPYRFTRNPMFLGELMLWLGWAFFYGSVTVLVVFLLLSGIMNFIAVPREERELEAKFGEGYREYREKVPRWL